MGTVERYRIGDIKRLQRGRVLLEPCALAPPDMPRRDPGERLSTASTKRRSASLRPPSTRPLLAARVEAL